MSLILEALKKSDAERQRSAGGQRPAAVTGPKNSPNVMGLVLVAIVIVVSATIGWYAWRDTEPLETPVAATETLSIPSSEPAEPDAPVQKPVAVIAVAPASVETIAPVAAKPAVKPPLEPGPAESVAAIAVSEPVNSIPPAIPRLVDLQPETAPPAPIPATAAVVPERPPIMTFSQLSPALQAEIGELTLNVLVFAEQTADRFVLINLRRYQTGDRVKDQLSVAEIRADGVVLDYDGRQFLLDTQF
jgi:general secretion pathway protein B